MILILSDKFDAHAELVCSQLTELNFSYFRLNLDTESLRNTSLRWDSNIFVIEAGSKTTTSDNIKCVWVRRAFVELSLDEGNSNDPGLKIWKGEWDRCLIGLYQILKEVPWLNKLDKSYKADNKFLQYILAKQLGFKVAPIITANIKSDLIEFARKFSPVVLKMLHQGFYTDSDGKSKGMYVNKITTADLAEFGDISENPITLQAYIHKEYEVRYTVVGDDHHVCKIESQNSPRASVDWRRYDLANTPHSLIDPPTTIKKQVSALMKVLDLTYGALDFIVEPNGDWTFLEINSMGQWLWIENLTGANISNSISNWLSTR
jgi:glutathione synthase/RimK-type ligase-like ATP-grasp enzyme